MYAVAVHGGAGSRPLGAQPRPEPQPYRSGLAAALTVGQQILARHGSALDAVEAAVAVLEDDPLFNAGRGAVLTLEGTAELDASIMDGSTLRVGAVAQLRRVKNPIHLARRVLEQSPHVFLVGEGAEAYALQAGTALVPNAYFITPHRQQQLSAIARDLAAHRQTAAQAPAPAQPARQSAPGCSIDTASSHERAPCGTVGAVARDERGRLAAATSTGGTAGQRAGRVGDSPVPGAGTYADDECCAVSSTGHGEAFLRTVLAYDIVARMRYRGDALELAVEQALHERLAAVGGRGGVIGVDRHGAIAARHSSAHMYYGYVASNLELHINA